LRAEEIKTVDVEKISLARQFAMIGDSGSKKAGDDWHLILSRIF